MTKFSPLNAEIGQMSVKDKLALLEKIKEAELEAIEKEKAAIAADPFWFYEPSTGHIGPQSKDFLLRHLKPEDIPPVFPGQIDVHKSTAPIRGAAGGNQSGKTTAGAIEAFIQATGEVPPSLKDVYPKERLANNIKTPQKIRVTAKDWENGFLLNVLPTYQYWCPKEYLKNGRWQDSYMAEKATLILQKNGLLYGTIEFMSNAQNVTSFQGPPRDKMIYDEEPKREIYKENLMRFITRKNLDVLFCTTPTEGLTWVWDMVNSGEDESGRRVEWFCLPSVSNKLSNIQILEQIVQDLTYEEKKMRLLGEFVSLSGLVYGKCFSRKLHVIDPFPVACNCGTQTLDHSSNCPWNHFIVYRGLDPHLVTPTACVWLAVDRFENYYVVDSWFEEAETDRVKLGIAKRSQGMRLGWSVVDSASDSDIQAFGGHNIYEKLKRGDHRIKNLRLASKGQGSIRSGVDEIKTFLQLHHLTRRPRLFFFNTPNNRLLIKAMETMERQTGLQEDKRGPQDKILESKHHLHAAMRYIFTQKVKWRDPNESFAFEEPDYEREEVYA